MWKPCWRRRRNFNGATRSSRNNWRRSTLSLLPALLVACLTEPLTARTMKVMEVRMGVVRRLFAPSVELSLGLQGVAPFVSDLHDLFNPIFAKALTESAIQQRLRRMCSKRKNGTIPAGDDAAKLFADPSRRTELGRLLAESRFDKETFLCMSCNQAGKLCCFPVCRIFSRSPL